MFSRLVVAAVCGVLALGATVSTASAQVQVKPWFMLVLDSSGSMAADRNRWASNSCGYPISRMNDAKCAVTRIVDSTGDAVFGLMQFDQNCSTSQCAAGAAATLGVAGGNRCDDTRFSGLLRVPIYEDNQLPILGWVDNICGPNCSGTNINEVWARGMTPLSGSLRRARWYYRGGGTGVWETPLFNDTFAACRPVSVILLTDGAETCGGNPAARAGDLRSTTVTLSGGRTLIKDIRTYVIGYGIAPGDGAIEAIATQGGTDSPDPSWRGFYATDEASLALALSQIIASSVLYEVCDGLDNNCNGVVDEGFPLFCNLPAGITTQTECMDPGETVCDGLDDNCNGAVDEGLLNACGTCGALPVEVCDGLDNNCDGRVDEGGVCPPGCTPTPEICNNIDDNCNILIDDGLSRPCGVTLGICMAGVETCTAGVWGGCTATTGVAERCDGLDNDCDGVVDGMVRTCGSAVGECRAGAQICTAGAWSGCTGAVGPGMERCDGLDNDCNGMTDESDPQLGNACGSSVGECAFGSLTCPAGMLVCTGGTGPVPETCNGLDDDCNGVVDDGLGVGSACGSAVGECRPGLNICRGGMVVCSGEVGPGPETCNGLDDDCDTVIDNLPPGAACGTDVGACLPGRLECVAGAELCSGGRGPTLETCNCIDDDCDGMVDETTDGPLCPGGSECTGCQCSLPCLMTEFGFSCPTGRVPNSATDPCFCVTPRCDPVACGAETQMATDGAVLCAPGSTEVTACVCQVHDCTNACNGVICASGLVCNPRDPQGRCVIDSCVGLGCPGGELCDAVSGTCVVDPCLGLTCASDEVCRAGACERSCAMVTCPSGQRCHAGSCVADGCAGVTCAPPLVCDPLLNGCIGDRCVGTTCPVGRVCESATGTCSINPCDAVHCPAGQSCRGGDCYLIGFDAGVGRRVLAAGGGEGCSVGRGGGSTPALMLFVVALLALLRKRTRA